MFENLVLYRPREREEQISLCDFCMKKNKCRRVPKDTKYHKYVTDACRHFERSEEE